ncbi:DNA ligase [Buchnera aphidicola str. Bp (Baizongia pistaciae)]|uniref:DNA ligase n=1 Tax=Buchnera aphidicola subsp. Baizongia pistaciae (strain Bp) TaxID=224915 RepID=DNLJ_BUCBP|nr:NAD-dependent DNA ligase LigA [Buchnera aphidicola]Q89B02.1 RecName: Full=DNA ligase; AltName: Full=Polydeoxyribonucleotide synthase [NAD(+)] [Buchnera aphidicola str. Bp (Baizongia pistaciae)]AAO26801.1 DNA ligase [Buchnera aphidicola str. Bp (Baizongia pistaciae)]
MKDIKNYILKLQDEIRYHAYLYHTLNSPKISDEKYDFLVIELQRLEKKCKYSVRFKDSPTQSVGSENLPEFKKFSHITPMLSLNNVFIKNDFLKFYKKIVNNITVEKIFFCSELKFDGVAINLIYINGLLFRAVTRGNGYEGEDVTSNVNMISSVPKKLIGIDIPETLEVRGEIFMLKSDFKKLNVRLTKFKKKLFSNSRNAASGSLRHKNAKVTELRSLTFYCYGCGYCSYENFTDSHFLRLKKLKSWGFPISDYNFLHSSYDEILRFYNFIQNERYFLNFNIDGIVIKVDSICLQKSLSTTSKAPRWAVAYKFSDKIKITTIMNILYQVGRTGVITPVAQVTPIYISGVLIKKVSLHNFNEIRRLNLNIGDSVFIKRSGDVIPHIIEVASKCKLQRNEDISIPKFCPECGSKLKVDSFSNIKIRCMAGLKCLSQFKKLLHYFCSKKGLNILGLGPKIIDKLVDLGYVSDLSDIFDLNVSLLTKVENIGIIKSQNIIRSINNSKNVSFSKFLCSLGIFEVGSIVARSISNYFFTLDKFMNSSKEEFLLINGIGVNIADNLYNFINDEFNKNIIFKLSKKLNISSDINAIIDNNNTLFRKKIVFSGSFSNFSRSKIIELSKKLGIIVVSSVSKSVDYIIIGKKPGRKLIKAKKFSIPGIYEKEFLNIINVYL